MVRQVFMAHYVPNVQERAKQQCSGNADSEGGKLVHMKVSAGCMGRVQ